MTSKQFFIETIKDELPRFERVFKSIINLPKNKLSWRPHKKSRNTQELLMVFVADAGTYPMFLKTGTVDMAEVYKFKQGTPKTLWLMFKKHLNDSQKIVQKMSEKDWDKKATMTYKGKIEWETTRGNMAWSLLLDLIHHRGQLSVYLRPIGAKVPSIYGPSGDSK